MTRNQKACSRPLLAYWSSRAALAIALLSGLVAAASGQAPAPPASSSVAVADFEREGDQTDTRDWAFGLADVMAVELQQRGVVLFERQQIRMVLGERRLTASGLMQLRATAGWDIPDLRYLVTGRIGRGTNQQFRLEASLVEAQTGRNAASFSAQGHYPDQLAGALASLAEQLVRRLDSQGAAPRPGREPGTAITHTPESSLPFYKGVAYCLAGLPEMGLTWFIDAQQVAPTSLPARLWTMRAFEVLGLPDFADVARANVREAPNGPGVLNRLKDSPFLDKKLVSVAVIPDLRLEASGLQLASALKTALGRATNLFVADPSNLRSLAAEMDLQLTEKAGHDLELGSVLWSAVDALVFVRPSEEASGSVSVELHDAVSGATLFGARTPRDGSELASLARELAQQVSSRRKTGFSQNLRQWLHVGRARKPAQVSNTDRDEFAGLLKYLAENPADRPGWMRLALFVRWLNAGAGGRYDGGYERVIADRVLAATDPKSSDAASWTATALWHRRYYESPPPRFAVEFAPLLERYPSSPEALNVRSGVAMDYLDQHQYAEAAKIFLKLQEELPNLPGDVKVGPDYWANLYFFTGAAFYQLGDEARARQFLSQCAEVLRNHADVGLLPYSLGVNWRNPFPQRHPFFGDQRELREGLLAWQARLSLAPKNDAKTPLTLEQLESLLLQAGDSSSTNAASKRVEYLRRLIEHKQLNPSLYKGRITDSSSPDRGTYRKVAVWGQGTTYGYFSVVGKLVNEAIVLLSQLAAGSAHDPGQVGQLAHALAENLDAPIAANIYESVGEYDNALKQVEKAIGNPSPFPPIRYVGHPTRQQYETRSLRKQKIRLLQVLGKPAEAAAYARTQLRQSDADANLAATVDAAEAYKAIGRTDEGCQIFAEFVRAEEPGGTMDKQSAAARLWWAEYEVGRGNTFQATELLRQVVQHSEGKGWDTYLRHGYVKTYEEASSRLAKVRSQADFPVASTDWEHPPSPPTSAPEAEASEPSAMQRDLDALLRGTRTGPNSASYGGAAVGEFSKRYGHAAVPAIVQAASRGAFPAHLIATFKLLDQLATPDDAPLVLEAFKSTPQLAPTAFRLDRTNAATILAERFAIYAKGGEIPRELQEVIAKYHLRDQYRVLVANLTAKEINGNTAPNAAALDRMLRRGAPSQVRQSFRAALGSILEKEMLMNYRYGLAGLSETALRNGVPQGIEAVLRSEDPGSTNGLARLRKYMDLPADDTAALAAVQSGLGRWQWEPRTKKFVLGTGSSQKRASLGARIPLSPTLSQGEREQQAGLTSRPAISYSTTLPSQTRHGLASRACPVQLVLLFQAMYIAPFSKRILPTTSSGFTFGQERRETGAASRSHSFPRACRWKQRGRMPCPGEYVRQPCFSRSVNRSLPHVHLPPSK